MAVSVPSNAKFGFWVAIGVLSALAVWSMVQKRVPALA
jgi:hypothetical protein